MSTFTPKRVVGGSMETIKNNRLNLILATVALTFSAFTFAATSDEARTAHFISCEKLNEVQIGAQVKNDFMHNRLPRWQDEKAILGSKAVAWVNNNNITQTPEGYQVPLDVRGAKKDLRYNVQVDCVKNTITYQPIK